MVTTIDRILNTKLWKKDESLEVRYNSIMGAENIGGEFIGITWQDGTEEEIKTMLKQHYLGNINIEDYWNLGDARKVQLSEIRDGITNELQPEQTIELVIIGFNHDVLVNSIGIRDKAAVTVQVNGCLSKLGYMNEGFDGAYDSEWFSSRRRIWCNTKFKSALPEYLQKLIVGVIKMTNVYLSNHEGYHISTIDDCFLLSDWEVFGKQSLDKDMWVDLPADGKQYPGILSTNLKYMGKCNSINCWLRTSLIGITSCANFIKTCGDDTHCVDIPSTDGGITPAFCL